jgi:V8-like Glu-specific endopeptidase
MDRIKSFIIIGTMLTTTVAVAGENKSYPVSKDYPTTQVTNYWTPERLRDAVPMDLPRVELGSLKNVSITQTEKPTGNDGSPPTVEITPDNTLLFQPKEEPSSIQPEDAGSFGQQFTSSRLLPTTNDTLYPYRTVGKLFFTTPSGNKTCTASVIRNRIILTAGHCVHNGNGSNSGYYTNFLFIPAYNSGAAPYQSWSSSYPQVGSNWFTGGGTIPNSMDYGMLEIVDKNISGTVRSIGSVTGYLGWQTGSTIPNHAHIIGYSNNLDGGNLMHQVTAQSARAVDANNVEYGSDLSVGGGGSPWIQNFGTASTGQISGTNSGRNRVIGTSAYAYNDTTTLSNGGSIFDNNFVTLLNTMCAHQAGNC